MCENDFWGSLATYVCEIYEIEAGLKNAGKGLASSTAAGVWSGLGLMTHEDQVLQVDFASDEGAHAAHARRAREHAPNVPNVPNVPARTGCRPASAQDFLRCSSSDKCPHNSTNHYEGNYEPTMSLMTKHLTGVPPVSSPARASLQTTVYIERERYFW